MTQTKSVLLVHPQFDVIGGAELVSLCLLEWLTSRDWLKVTLLTMRPFDCSEVARKTPFRIDPVNLTVKIAFCPAFLGSSEAKFELLKLAFLHRAARRLAGSYDVCVSSYGEVDFGRPGFQYIHFPLFGNRRILQPYVSIDGDESLIDRFPFLNNFYRLLVSLVSRDRLRGFRRNTTAVNSIFVQKLVREVYGIQSEVVYPVLGDNSRIAKLTPWESRPLRFASVARISRNKNLLGLLGLFRALKDRFPESRFLVIGRLDHPTVEKEMRDKAESLGLELELLVDVDMERKNQLLQESKFYIHGKKYEHFGISILEAIQHGCLPLVPNSGGQVEIVTPNALRFDSDKDLVSKVTAILHDSSIRANAQKMISERMEHLTSRQFILQVTKLLSLEPDS